MIAGNRPINYLRISVTDRCNFRCRYCIPSTPFNVIEHKNIARYEEILRITRLACELGITKVRITGGEPFVRKGILNFLDQLCRIKTLTDISITTNGALLTKDKIKRLIDLGIKRMNFSLDTLDPQKFFKITRRDRFEKVWNTVTTAHEMGMAPIKVNAVILKGLNDDEIEDITALTLKYPFHVRFIEYMPMGNSDIEKKQLMLTHEIIERIETRFGKLIPIRRTKHDGPAKKYQISNARGIVGFITAISSHFCSDCNRLRLTSRGTLRPCLLNNYEKDILTPLRKGAGDEDLKQIIVSALTKKPAFHGLSDSTAKCVPISHMTSIGG